MSNKILLIRPDGGGGMLPNGILYISSYLEKHGYETIVKDLTFDTIEDDIWKGISSRNISIVGISMLSDKRKQAYELIRKIKSLNKNVKIIIGGLHATALPKLLVDNLQIDATVIGEGEATMKKLADYWIKNTGKLKDIRGIATKKYGIHKPRELIENLDDLPFPNYDKVNMGWYHSVMARNRPDEIVNGIKISEAKYANIISSRGCKGRCKFCSAPTHWGFKTRFRSAENVLDEIEYLYNEKEIRLFQIADDSFGQNKEIAIDVCRGIVNREMKIAWHTDMRVDAANPEMLEWMKKSGCFVIAYGFESGSQRILDNLGKDITVRQIRDATMMTKKAGIKVYALLMIGNELETDGTVAETINLMNDIQPDIYSTVGFVLLCPATVYNEIMKKDGSITDDYWVKEEDGLPIFVHGFGQADLNRWYDMLRMRVPQRW